ncbi:MAG: DUF5640 domain-containing protein [Oscillospiraceae bacterium]|nr:DUF5640 domain-containing protein [Oscillospiraceae bacterium]
MIKRLLTVALLITMLFGLMGCGDARDVSDHPLVGTWSWVEDGLWQWQFQADGTGTRGVTGEETRFVWSIEDGGHLRLNVQGGSRESWSYLISGYSLTLDNRQLAGETYTYRRADAPPDIREEPAEPDLVPDVTTLLGKWECQDDTVPHAWMCLLLFEEGGRFTDSEGDTGTFVIDGSYLTFLFDGFQPIVVEFILFEDILTLQGDNINVVLVRQS